MSMNDPVRTESARVDILDPLRGLAALAVAWFHFTFGSELLADGWLKSTGAYADANSPALSAAYHHLRRA